MGERILVCGQIVSIDWLILIIWGMLNHMGTGRLKHMATLCCYSMNAELNVYLLKFNNIYEQHTSTNQAHGGLNRLLEYINTMYRVVVWRVRNPCINYSYQADPFFHEVVNYTSKKSLFPTQVSLKSRDVRKHTHIQERVLLEIFLYFVELSKLELEDLNRSRTRTVHV